MTEGLEARRAALGALAEVDAHGRYSTVAVPDAVSGLPTGRDRAFASHLAYDAMRWEGTLDWLLGLVVDRPLGDVEPGLLRVLRLGALQLWRTDVAAHAAVSTSVDLARGAVPGGRGRGAAGFANGVLRALARRLDDDLPWPPDPVESLALRTAHPVWIVEDLRTRHGQRTEAILAADNEPPGLTLRADGDRDELVAELRSAGLPAEPGQLSGRAVRAPGGDPRRIAAVAEGRATPQDEASMLVVDATGVTSGARVLDVCAGPGGKAGDLARRAGPGGTVVAVELHEHRAVRVRETAERLGVAIDVRTGDARDPGLLADDPEFDVVLVDAPCTGLGTGRRRPEVRWRRTAADAAALARLQAELLAAAAPHVVPGGTLTYAVCTWTRAETDRVADGFEQSAAGADFEPVSRRQYLPDTDGTDGMYVAGWRRLPEPRATAG